MRFSRIDELFSSPVESWREALCGIIAEHGRLIQFDRKEVVFTQGEKPNGVFAIKNGLVDIASVNEVGREVTYSIRGPGEHFGYSEIVLGEQRQRSAVILRDATLWTLGVSEFMQFISDRPDAVLAMLGSTLHRFTRSNETRVNLRGRSAECRIAYTMVQLARQLSGTAAPQYPTTLHLTHEEVGRLCDTSRQTVTLILDGLREEGILDLGHRTIQLHDLRQLEERTLAPEAG